MPDYKEKHLVKTTAAAIITQLDVDGVKVLLTRRGYPPFKGQWCLPGGHIEKYEPAHEAIMREVKEEVGLDFEARFFRYFDEIIPEKNIHAVVLVFDGPVRGKLAAQPGEVTEMGWFTLEEIHSMPLAFQHNGILEAYSEKTWAPSPPSSSKQ